MIISFLKDRIISHFYDWKVKNLKRKDIVNINDMVKKKKKKKLRWYKRFWNWIRRKT